MRPIRFSLVFAVALMLGCGASGDRPKGRVIPQQDGLATVDGPEDRREGNEKARPLSSKELSGTWLGEKESVKVEITFRGTDDAKWHLNTVGATYGANIGADLKRVDDPQSGRVLLRFDYRSTSTGELGSAVLGCVERGEADTLQLTILPKATEFVKEYKPVERILLNAVNDKER